MKGVPQVLDLLVGHRLPHGLVRQRPQGVLIVGVGEQDRDEAGGHPQEGQPDGNQDDDTTAFLLPHSVTSAIIFPLANVAISPVFPST